MESAPLESGLVAGAHPGADHGAPRDTLESQLGSAGLGDESAFVELYDRLAPRVYGLVRRILRDAHQSEEVTQEVFLQVWETSNRFDPARGSALSWVMTLAHRRAVDRVRATAAQRRRDAGDAERGLRTPFDQTAETAHASLDATTLRRALAMLTPTQREALELAYFGGHTHVEVSRLLHVPLGTAKTRIRDGLIRLRDGLEPPATEPA